MVDKFQAEFKMDHSYQTSEILRINQQYSFLDEINNSETIGSPIRFLQFVLLNKVQASTSKFGQFYCFYEKLFWGKVHLAQNFFGHSFLR